MEEHDNITYEKNLRERTEFDRLVLVETQDITDDYNDDF